MVSKTPGYTDSLFELARVFWAVCLVTLPVTSFRYFPFLGDTTYVRPLAFLPLAFLLPILFILWWRRDRLLPLTGSMILLGLFCAVVLLSSTFGYLLNPVDLRGNDYTDRVIRALLTLAIGLAFFLAAGWMNRDETDLRFTIQWILIGFGIDLAWSCLQVVTFYTPLIEKEALTHWQLAFSMRELVRTNRISGLAYEPAWLAGQISTLYLPWLFASLLGSHSATKYKWLDLGLLGLAFLALLATFSRGGLLTSGIAATITFLVGGGMVWKRFWNWFLSGFRGVFGWTNRLGMIAGILILLSGTMIFLSQKGYFARLWSTQAESLEEFLVENSAGARAAYTAGAMAAYQDHPWLGVGLGASGFYIYQNLPDWALTDVPEIARQLNPENKLFPNPKNLYIRLLAELGLIGFMLYLVFQFFIAGEALTAYQGQGMTHYLGLAGIFACVAIAAYSMTQDSFAVPNLWIIPGILAGFGYPAHTNRSREVNAPIKSSGYRQPERN